MSHHQNLPYLGKTSKTAFSPASGPFVPPAYFLAVEEKFLFRFVFFLLACYLSLGSYGQNTGIPEIQMEVLKLWLYSVFPVISPGVRFFPCPCFYEPNNFIFASSYQPVSYWPTQQGKNPLTLEVDGKKPAVLAFAECRTRNASRRL